MSEYSSCTTILVGKNASLDGSTLVARNEDGHDEPEPQQFVVVDPNEQPRVYHTFKGQVEIPLPEQALRYTATPNANTAHGIFGASGINSAQVAMSATETITTNARVLGADPYVEASIGEADMVTLVLPYIKTPREGVLRMGKLLEEYGTYEPNGMVFSDKDEIWYMETFGGHHWAAIRIPDDCYVVAPNRLNIDTFDFNSPHVLYSEDLPDFISRHHLNPDRGELNLRHTLGSADYKDVQYNNPRAWYVQKYFSQIDRPYDEKYPFVDDPACPDLPFLCYPKRKLSVEDIKWALSSHYEGTPYDAYGSGTEAEKKRYRAIGLNRNMEVHILQIRPHVPAAISGIHWLGMASNPYNCMVPFYTTVADTPACYRNTPVTYDPNYLYWLTQTLAVIGDRNYTLFGTLHYEYEKHMNAVLRHMQQTYDEEFKRNTFSPTEAVEFLTQANEEMAQKVMAATKELLGQFVCTGSHKMTLRFNLAD